MKRLIIGLKGAACLFALLAVLMTAGTAAGEQAAGAPQFGGEIVKSFDSPTLKFSVERFSYDGARCYLSRIWMQEPGRQIIKATSKFKKNVMLPSEMAKKLPVKAMLVVNGSGYVTKQFPQIPENYPGRGPDYYNTPLGSLTITNGELLRDLEGVPYYGLTLQSDGLHMHVGEANEDVLAQEPTETWSFYVQCPLIRDGQSILDREWKFANERNIRTIIAKMDDNNYILLTVTHKTNPGVTLVSCVDFLLNEVHPVWAYNLDGGPSAALLVRENLKEKLKTVYGNNSKDVDIMAFCELPE